MFKLVVNFVVEIIKYKKVKDEPIGKLVRPIKLYRGYIFPTNIKLNQNFSAWFTNTVKMQCLFQTTAESNCLYKQYTKNSKKDILQQFKEFNFKDTIDNLNILNGYTAEITGFIYYFKQQYHVCRTKKEESAMILKSKRSKNLNISFGIVKFYNKVDLSKKKGLEEWIYHSSESFELIYPIKDLISLDHILKLEFIKPGSSLKTTKQEYIVLNVTQNEKNNIIFHSLSLYNIFCLSQTSIKKIKLNISYTLTV
jgi:hypothetical protein